MVVQQGDLVWVRFPAPRGSEPSGRRPALVIQSDPFNSSRLSTIVVAAITSQLKYESLPGNVRLLKNESGIPKASVINMTQIHSVDREFIESKIGSLSQARLGEVKVGLKLLFGFSTQEP